MLDHIDRLAAQPHSAVFTGLPLADDEDGDEDVVEVWRIPSAASTPTCATPSRRA